jgi:hypothetical protein
MSRKDVFVDEGGGRREEGKRGRGRGRERGRGRGRGREREVETLDE